MSELDLDQTGPLHELTGELALADWRRQTAELYAEVRRAQTPADGHAVWRAGRDRMFRGHPQSPLDASDVLRGSGLPYWPYDPRWRFLLPLVREDQSVSYELPTAADEITRIRQIGWAQLTGLGGARLAVWWHTGQFGTTMTASTESSRQRRRISGAK